MTPCRISSWDIQLHTAAHENHGGATARTLHGRVQSPRGSLDLNLLNLRVPANFRLLQRCAQDPGDQTTAIYAQAGPPATPQCHLDEL